MGLNEEVAEEGGLCMLKPYQRKLPILLDRKHLKFSRNELWLRWIKEKEKWEDKPGNHVHWCSSFNFMCPLPQCRSLARLSDVIISFLMAHNSDRLCKVHCPLPCFHQGQRANSKAFRTKSHLCIRCLHSWLVSSNTSVIPVERTHMQQEEPLWPSTRQLALAQRWTARYTPNWAMPKPLKGEIFLYCRWQNTYFVPVSSRWKESILKSQWED